MISVASDSAPSVALEGNQHFFKLSNEDASAWGVCPFQKLYSLAKLNKGFGVPGNVQIDCAVHRGDVKVLM